LTKSLKHLTVEAVKAIHREVLAAHGGAAGIRDETLLESAVAAPQASMMGQPLISDPLEIAAAYLFYICRNHPFLDGNKRTALAACLVFLEENGLLPDRNCRSTTGNRSLSTWRRAKSIVTRLLAGFANCSKNPEEALTACPLRSDKMKTRRGDVVLVLLPQFRLRTAKRVTFGSSMYDSSVLSSHRR